jgi:hypothetical protein
VQALRLFAGVRKFRPKDIRGVSGYIFLREKVVGCCGQTSAICGCASKS